MITALLASCDLQLVIGRRDFAVLLLLSRLGLRAGEVAAIRLDDVDWRAGELLVHGKGHREDTMLPVDVGEALVEYLRVRPASEHRALFLCALAPFGPVSSHVVAMIVRRACRRAGIPGGRGLGKTGGEGVRGGRGVVWGDSGGRGDRECWWGGYACVGGLVGRLGRPWPGGQP